MSLFSKFNQFSLVSGIEYVLDSPVYWDIGKKGSGYTLSFETGVRFDISVPVYLRWILSPHNRIVLLAAMVHDKLVEEGYDIAFSSAEFRRACVARGLPKWKAWILFFATFYYLLFKKWLGKEKQPKY